MTLPAAIEKAVYEYVEAADEQDSFGNRHYAAIASKPNHILAAEDLRLRGVREMKASDLLHAIEIWRLRDRL